MRKTLKKILANLPVDNVEKILAYCMLKQDFPQLATVPMFSNREQLWDDCIDRFSDARPLTYVEFGVFEGYSIRYFSETVRNPQSKFFGLDSFEGLPEDWGSKPKGTFDVQGNMPLVNDERVSFIKGWFQDSMPTLLNQLNGVTKTSLVVHYDADLYSSTLYCLAAINSLNVSYYAIFDEFTGHETRALKNYIQAFGASVQFLGKTETSGFPGQVLCKISPHFT